MGKSNRGKYFIFAMSIVCALLLTACGSTSSKESIVEQNTVNYKTNNYASADYSYEAATAKEAYDAADAGAYSEATQADGASENGSLLSEEAAAAESGRKLVKEASLDVETKAFDRFISDLAAEVEALGGYIEYSSVSGSSYLSENGQRTAWYTARIPEDKLEDFISKIGDNGNITNVSRNVRDITLEYVDVAGRISTLKSELERLEELLGQASSMEDILAIESKISDVRYELESYQSQMNTYDNLVDYSTVEIYVLEVDVVSASQGDSAWDQIQSGFMNSLYGLGRGLSSFIIGLLSAIPYLAVIALVIFIFVKVVHKRGKKKKERRAEEARGDETDK